MTNQKVIRALIVFIVSFCSARLFAQTITGSVNGVVTDPSGATIPNAKVVVDNVNTGVSTATTTNGSGLYSIRFLQVGQYKVTVDATGFAARTLGPFALEAGQDAKFDAKLGVAGTASSVDVSGTFTPLLNTESAELGTTLDAHAIDSIPLQGRNFSSLTIFVPGAVVTNPSGFTGANALERSTGGSGQVSVNGNRQQSNNFLLDGIEINETINNTIAYNPSPDALDQVRVVSANAQAEYGNVNGGDVIALLKSGTNKLHGSGFYYVTNYNFNANTWAAGLVTPVTPKTSLTSNIFGGTIGGPIIKDKLFFFADYSGNRYHTGGVATANVATAKMRNGDFSELLDPNLTANKPLQLYDSRTAGAPAYANNRLPASAISPVAAYLFTHPELYPLPNQAATAGTVTSSNYLGITKTRIYNDQFDAKVDYNLSAKDTMFFRYSQSTAGDTNTRPLAIVFPTASTYPTKSFAYQIVHTFNPAIQNELRIGFLRTVWHQGLPNDTTGVFGLSGNSIVGIQGGNQAAGFSAQSISGFGGATLTTVGNAASYSDNLMNNFTYADNLTIAKGRHVIKMGAQLIRYQQNSIYTGNDGAQGTLTYNGNFTARNGTGTAISTASDTGNGIADFYLDRVFSAGRGTLAGHTGQRQWRDALFVQDDYKLSPNLTFNIGLRWEYDQPIYEVNNKEANLNLVTGAVQLAGVNGNSRALYNSVYSNFMPRLGFSYNVIPRVVVRGGFGSTTYLEGTGANLRLTINPPFQTSISYTGATPTAGNTGTSTTAAGAFSANSAACAYATNPACGQILRAWDVNLRPSTVQEYSLTTEYQLNNHSSFQIGYVGEHAYHLIQAVNGNQLVNPCYSATGALLAYNSAACFAVNKSPFYSVVGQSGFVRITSSQGSMNYNALQSTFRQRTNKGLQFTVNYTYSKSLTNNIGFFGVSSVNQNSAYASDPRNILLEYGPAGTDARHNLNFNMTYDLPFGRGRAFGTNTPRILDAIFGGYKVAFTGFAYSGFPTTITNTANNSGVNSGQQRALHLRKLNITGRDINHWFGTDASATPCVRNAAGVSVDNGVCAYGYPTDGTISPARPNSERAPGYRQFDASVFKAFNITENSHVDFRLDGSNVFNIASYGNPDRVAQSTTFGKITDTRSQPRQLQLSAKFVF